MWVDKLQISCVFLMSDYGYKNILEKCPSVIDIQYIHKVLK